jgi:Cu+-exporting ATPase
LRRRFYWTLPLTGTVFKLAMFGPMLFRHPLTTQNWIEFALCGPVVVWAGWPFLACWAQSLSSRRPNMWTLTGTGILAAFAYSVVTTLFPRLFPPVFASHGTIAVYFEPRPSSSH